ncbi:MAG: glycoside hydrolase family 5 protein [Huintestinicola sp.]
MKKTLSFIFSLVLISSMFCGCGNTSEGQQTPSAEVSASVESSVTEQNPVEFVKDLKMGWNLGNTLDATGGEGMSSETSWGQPEVTKELIEYVKASGFTSIRIPVSWGNHTDAEYNIAPQWMSRVTDIVNYALDSGLYVIINSHHDCDYYYPTEEKYEKSSEYIRKIWTQISENFKDYDERLIFEAMNEPRLTGTNKEWWFADNDAEGVESIKVIMKLNQEFVDTVRNQDGFNKTRFLMVPSNAASAGNALNPAFEMPSDPSNKLILSVHAYTPYDFAMNEKGYSNWDGKHANELGFMDQLNDKFIKNGYGVVIGEFGATNKDNLADRVAWAKDYTSKAASLGIPCFLWDNGGTNVGSENFGMINRRTLEISYPDILNMMTESYE